jgi:type I restriction enzyme S subunit
MGVASYCEAERFWPLNTSLFVEDFKGNDPRFLFHLFQLTDLTGYNSGSAQPMLNRNYIRDVVFLMPGIEEQRAISGVLKALDDKIAVNDRIVTAIEELSAAIFRNSFTEALTFLTRGDELPYEWTADVMGGVCSVLETGRRPKGGVSGYADGVPSIGAESITRLGEFDFAKVKYVPEEFFAGMRQGIIEDYDILLYKDGGRPGNFEPHVSMFGRGFPFERMCINEHVYRIRLANPLSQAYGYFWLTSEPVMTEMRSRGTGVAIPGLNSSAVRELPVAYPAVDRLTRFNETVLPMIDRALSAASESRGLGQLRDTLLPKLMSGAIRVRDAEKVVEDVT